VSERPVEAIERILGGTDDADDVLRAAVAALVFDPGIVWAGVSFLDDGELVLGPEAGEQDVARRVRVPITFHHVLVGELWADGSPDARCSSASPRSSHPRSSSAGTRAAKCGSRRPNAKSATTAFHGVQRPS
jgi:hypothetical protein